MQLLATIPELKDATGINPGIENKDPDVVRMIKAAQLEDIRPLVGDRMFWDIVDDPTRATSGRNYAALLAETEYSYESVTYTSPGLKAVLFEYVFARYRYFNQEIDTPSGFGQIEGSNIQRSSETRNLNIYSSLRKLAESNWIEVRNYLDRVDPSFTYWYGSEKNLDHGEEKIVLNKVTVR